MINSDSIVKHFTSLDDNGKRALLRDMGIIPLVFRRGGKDGKDVYPARAGMFARAIPIIAHTIYQQERCLASIGSGRIDLGNATITNLLKQDHYYDEETGIIAPFLRALQEHQSELYAAMGEEWDKQQNIRRGRGRQVKKKSGQKKRENASAPSPENTTPKVATEGAQGPAKDVTE